MMRKKKAWELTKRKNETRSEREFRLSLQDGLKHAMGLPSKVKVEKIWLPLKGVLVKEARKTLKASQIEFAEKLHVSPETVRKWEQGRNPVEGPAAILIKGLLNQPNHALPLLNA